MSYNETMTDERKAMPTYSFGVNSVLKVELTEEEALRYNRFQRAFFYAQGRMRTAGTPWDPSEPILIDVVEGDADVYNAVGKKINAAISAIDQDKTPIELEEDFLIKN